MSTLSFDLRGFEAKQTFPKEAKARSAGASFLIHIAFVSATVLVPLLGSSSLPEARDGSNEILIQPISVALPPPPMPESRATRNSTRPPLTRALVIEIATPPNVPAALNLDAAPDPEIAASQQSGLGTEGPGPKPGGDCPLGTMCGDAALPLANPTTVEIPRVGGLIKEPRLIASRSPQYPPIAQRAGVSGRVVIETHVGRKRRETFL